MNICMDVYVCVVSVCMFLYMHTSVCIYMYMRACDVYSYVCSVKGYTLDNTKKHRCLSVM